tara:strand:+ start:12045 stop:12557 length:513 start_codon:yes stop_codon:yes gene_type:complete
MWDSGKTDMIWDDSFKKLRYLPEPITGFQAEEWKRQGYTHDTTYGKMYGGKDPVPKWVHEVAENIGLTNCGFVFYRMDFMDIMPVHQDHYAKYCEIFGKEYEDVYRAVVFLDEWQSGHYFEIDGQGAVNWERGEYVIWKGSVPHSASNIGNKPRYTLQITGTKIAGRYPD